MAIKKPIPITFNLDSHQSVQSVCAVIHIDDKNTETLDLSLMQGGEHIAVSPNSTVTARFVRVKNNTLISDDIACAVQENGNIYIPIDNAAAHMLVGEIKIEVNIVDENDVLTMQFPLVIRVNNTILADAEICPISKGTIPELIEKAQETADNAQETADNAQQAADNAQATASTAQQTADGAQTAANSAQQTADNAMAELDNKQDKLTAGDNITIENNVISAEGGGATDYNELENKPTLNFYDSTTPKTLAGNVNFSSSFGFSDYTEGENITINLSRVFYNQLDRYQNYMYGFQIPGGQYFTAYYNFNNLHDRSLAGEMDYTNAGFFRGIGKNLVNTPAEFSDSIGEMSRVTIIHYSTQPTNEPLSNRYYLLRVIYFQDANTNKIRQFVQWIYFDSLQNTTVKPITDWQEIGSGGAQIVSGVVNANGTITFTDSEGNSFTTSGSNLVTSGNEQISVGYDNGGFYFLFDDGQEEVNNGTD